VNQQTRTRRAHHGNSGGALLAQQTAFSTVDHLLVELWKGRGPLILERLLRYLMYWAKIPCWYFIIKMEIAAQRAALVGSVRGRKTLADKNDHY
jgi:hypothetical protein